MASFTLEGKRVEIVAKPTFGECEWIEKQAGQGWDEMGGMTKMAALILLSVRRTGVAMTWAQVRDLSPADLEVSADDDEQEGEDVPPTPGGVPIAA